MRRLLIILVALCVAGTAYAEDFVLIKKKAPPAGGGACTGTDTYYGWDNVDGTSNDTGNLGYMIGMNHQGAFTVAGSGTVRVCSLTVYAYGSGNIRLAVFDNTFPTNNLVCQGSSEVAVSGASYTWQGHTAYTDIQPVGGSAGDACNLTLGTPYLLEVSYDSNSTNTAYKTETGLANSQGASDYTGGYPSTKAINGNGNIGHRLRVGVQ